MIRFLPACLVAIVLWGCQTVPETAADRSVQSINVQQTIDRMKAEDPAVARFLDSAYAYAVFPKIGSGGAGLGGGFGRARCSRMVKWSGTAR